MRKLPLLIVMMLAPGAQADESYSLSYAAAAVARLNRLRAAINAATCKRLGLATVCTQAEACVAAQADGGAACTVRQASIANARVFPDTTAGREGLVEYFALSAFKSLERQLLTEPEARRFCAWFTDAAAAEQRADTCTAAGLSADCNMCP